MLLTSFDPFAEVDRIARRAFGPAASPGMRMNAIRRDSEVELRFDAPGVDADGFDVTVDNGVLTVSASRSEEYSEGEKPYVQERVMGAFTRRIRLSDSVQAEKIGASYDAGVLTVRVPLEERAAARKVEVRTDAKAEITA